MRSAAMPRFSSKIPGFISYVILRKSSEFVMPTSLGIHKLGDLQKRISPPHVIPAKAGIQKGWMA